MGRDPLFFPRQTQLGETEIPQRIVHEGRIHAPRGYTIRNKAPLKDLFNGHSLEDVRSETPGR